jgi:hypothetical protein
LWCSTSARCEGWAGAAVGGSIGRLWPPGRRSSCFLLPAGVIVRLAVGARLVSGDPFRIERSDPLLASVLALRGAAFYLRQWRWPFQLASIYEMAPDVHL